MSLSAGGRTSRTALPPALFRSREELAAYITRGVYPSEQQRNGNSGAAPSVPRSKINRWEVEEKVKQAEVIRQHKLVNKVRDGISRRKALWREPVACVS